MEGWIKYSHKQFNNIINKIFQIWLEMTDCK